MPEPVSLDATVLVRDVQVALDVAPGNVLAVVGPNGAGKSTLVHLLSGDVRPDAGEVRVGPVRSTPKRHVPSHRRRCAVVGQKPLLFPHMSVTDNVAFGPISRGTPRNEARQRARDELELVGAGHLVDRRPGTLSGGQAQRVAIARALAIQPDVMLLDEPFAALDATVTPELRTLLRHRLAGITTVLVTHELLDVVALASHVLELDRGRVVTHGAVDEVFRRPGTGFLAQFLGLNMVQGDVVDDAHIRLGDGVVLTGLPYQPLATTRARAAFPPTAVSLFTEPPGGSPRNSWPCVVAGVEDRGLVQRVTLEVGDARFAADVTPESLRELNLGVGSRIFAAVKATHVSLYPVADGDPAS